ncbi:hypothetical protein pipiens_018208 [Culex pipiens pipiens]|uniref:HBS1-like protein N-terminal domain-containing protein n=1 Tax=Culex pipiens pipiens TaxID=38569 RepID=A0ABD1CD05_CULPP
MSRHRNVRTMNYDDEYDDDDDYLGHSVEDDCISPTDAQQWMYDRAKGQQSISAFLANNRDIEEEDDDGLEAERCAGLHTRRDSECYQLPELNDEDRVRLNSCMDEIRNIVGESATDKQLVEAIMKHGYNFDLALDDVLNSTKTPPTASSDDAEEATIPKLANLSLSNDSGVASSSPSEGTFSNLTDLAKFHLQAKGGGTPIGSPLGPTFTIPNLFNTPPTANRPPLTLASAARSNSQQNPLAKKQWIVDLKSALIKDKSELSSAKSNDAENEATSPPRYGFIDCDIVEKVEEEEDPGQKPIFDEFCSIDASWLAAKQLANVTPHASGLAAVLCRRYRKRSTVRVRHGFVTKATAVAAATIVPFRFHVPSPDDVVLGHMKKFRR